MKAARFYALVWLIASWFLPACMKEDPWQDRLPGNGDFSAGVLVVHEGNFGYGNASLSHYDPATGLLVNDVFFKRNGLPLGDVAQSVTVDDSLIYAVMNNSGKIMVMDRTDFRFVGKITGLTSPRYLHLINGEKAYVSDLYARSLAIVDPRTLDVTGRIDLAVEGSALPRHATEQMVQADRFVYVNCWSYDDQILIIDSESDRLVDSVRVGIQPNSMVLDRWNTLWVLCDGGFEGNAFGHGLPGLYRLEAGKEEADRVWSFPLEDSPRELKINGGGDTLYFLNRGVYRMAVEGGEPEQFVANPYVDTWVGGFYGLGIDPLSSDVYVADALDFVQRGLVLRYSSSGTILDSLRVGVVPSGFSFLQE